MKYWRVHISRYGEVFVDDIEKWEYKYIKEELNTVSKSTDGTRNDYVAGYSVYVEAKDRKSAIIIAKDLIEKYKEERRK